MPRLTRITLYPIKSFDGVEAAEAEFLGGGGLCFDRRFALRSADGNFVNGKGHAAVHAVRARYDLAGGTVALSAAGRPETTFVLQPGDADLERWCAEYFGFPVRLEENTETGFPDDLDSPGPTLISAATLRQVVAWFPGLTLEEVRRRFRANLEIDSDGDADPCPAFWEDRLFTGDAAPDAQLTVPFTIGSVRLEGVNPCARCVVPTRDSQTGEVRPKFAVEFGRRRQAELPAWAPAEAFDHFYRLAVNTRAPAAAGRTIQVGDEVQVN